MQVRCSPSCMTDGHLCTPNEQTSHGHKDEKKKKRSTTLNYMYFKILIVTTERTSAWICALKMLIYLRILPIFLH
jgi:hypothetical protein